MNTICKCLEDLQSRKTILEGLIEIYKKDLDKIDAEINDIASKFHKLQGIEEKVYYYRCIKGYTQEETAKIVDRTVRQVRNIEKKLKE